MSVITPMKVTALAGVLLAVAVVFVLTPAWAQTRSDEAESQRLNVESKAESKIGYPNVYDLYVGGSNTPAEYYALSQQIARLAAFLQAYGQSLESAGPTGVPGPSLPDPLIGQGSGLQALYGPDGPTAATVRAFLEYRLMVVGNPRLKVGPIHEDADSVFVKIVTTDNSLVEEYAVDKKTGQWKPLRK